MTAESVLYFLFIAIAVLALLLIVTALLAGLIGFWYMLYDDYLVDFWNYLKEKRGVK